MLSSIRTLAGSAASKAVSLAFGATVDAAAAHTGSAPENAGSTSAAVDAAPTQPVAQFFPIHHVSSTSGRPAASTSQQEAAGAQHSEQAPHTTLSKKQEPGAPHSAPALRSLLTKAPSGALGASLFSTPASGKRQRLADHQNAIAREGPPAAGAIGPGSAVRSHKRKQAEESEESDAGDRGSEGRLATSRSTKRQALSPGVRSQQQPGGQPGGEQQAWWSKPIPTPAQLAAAALKGAATGTGAAPALPGAGAGATTAAAAPTTAAGTLTLGLTTLQPGAYHAYARPPRAAAPGASSRAPATKRSYSKASWADDTEEWLMPTAEEPAAKRQETAPSVNFTAPAATVAPAAGGTTTAATSAPPAPAALNFFAAAAATAAASNGTGPNAAVSAAAVTAAGVPPATTAEAQAAVKEQAAAAPAPAATSTATTGVTAAPTFVPAALPIPGASSQPILSGPSTMPSTTTAPATTTAAIATSSAAPISLFQFPATTTGGIINPFLTATAKAQAAGPDVLAASKVPLPAVNASSAVVPGTTAAATVPGSSAATGTLQFTFPSMSGPSHNGTAAAAAATAPGAMPATAPPATAAPGPSSISFPQLAASAPPSTAPALSGLHKSGSRAGLAGLAAAAEAFQAAPKQATGSAQAIAPATSQPWQPSTTTAPATTGGLWPNAAPGSNPFLTGSSAPTALNPFTQALQPAAQAPAPSANPFLPPATAAAAAPATAAATAPNPFLPASTGPQAAPFNPFMPASQAAQPQQQALPPASNPFAAVQGGSNPFAPAAAPAPGPSFPLFGAAAQPQAQPGVVPGAGFQQNAAAPFFGSARQASQPSIGSAPQIGFGSAQPQATQGDAGGFAGFGAGSADGGGLFNMGSNNDQRRRVNVQRRGARR